MSSCELKKETLLYIDSTKTYPSNFLDFVDEIYKPSNCSPTIRSTDIPSSSSYFCFFIKSCFEITWNNFFMARICVEKHRVKPIIYMLSLLTYSSASKQASRRVERCYFSLPLTSSPDLRNLFRRPCDRSEKAGERERRGAPSNAISSYFYFPLRMRGCVRGCTPVHAHQVGSSVKRPAIIADIDLRYIVYRPQLPLFFAIRIFYQLRLPLSDQFFPFQIQDFIT